MKKKIRNIAAVIWILAALLPIRVFAAGGDAFYLDGTGTVTLVSQHAAKEKISSLQFSLMVDGAANVDFQFSASSAKVLEARYHKDTKILNIYLAGTKALFAENTDTLEIGKVLATDENGNNASATVSVVADSLWYVYGNEQIQAQGLEVPDAVSIGSTGNSGSGTGSNEGESGGTGNGSNEEGSGTGNGSNEEGGGTGSNEGESGDGSSGWNGSQGNQLGTDPGAPGIWNPGNSGSDQEDSAEEKSQGGGSGGQSKGSGRDKRQDGEGQESNTSSETDDVPFQPDTADAETVSESYQKLRETLETAQKLSEEDYTPESFQILKEMIARAQEVLEHPHVTEEELQEALLNLENAIGALERITEAGSSETENGNEKKGADFLVAGAVLGAVLLIAAAAFAAVTLHGKKGRNKNSKKK